VPAAVVCGHVFDPTGALVAYVELQLVRGATVVAKADADNRGNFMFGPVPQGKYDLTTKAAGWYLSWPVNVISSKVSRFCKQPLEVKLDIKTCGPSVSKKGYRVKWWSGANAAH
jgi:hypothetical protein